MGRPWAAARSLGARGVCNAAPRVTRSCSDYPRQISYFPGNVSWFMDVLLSSAISSGLLPAVPPSALPRPAPPRRAPRAGAGTPSGYISVSPSVSLSALSVPSRWLTPCRTMCTNLLHSDTPLAQKTSRLTRRLPWSKTIIIPHAPDLRTLFFRHLLNVKINFCGSFSTRLNKFYSNLF